MTSSISRIGGAAAALALSTTAVFAQGLHHHRPIAPQVGEYDSGNYDGSWQAVTIARAAARAELEPGLTKELAPDSRQTATGGPVGGLPGFGGR